MSMCSAVARVELLYVELQLALVYQRSPSWTSTRELESVPGEGRVRQEHWSVDVGGAVHVDLNLIIRAEIRRSS